MTPSTGGQAGVLTEIEITPEMIEAGACVLLESGVEGDHLLGRGLAEVIAEEILAAALGCLKT